MDAGAEELREENVHLSSYDELREENARLRHVLREIAQGLDAGHIAIANSLRTLQEQHGRQAERRSEHQVALYVSFIRSASDIARDAAASAALAVATAEHPSRPRCLLCCFRAPWLAARVEPRTTGKNDERFPLTGSPLACVPPSRFR